MRLKRRRTGVAVGSALVAGILAIPIVAWAASFTDVPESYPFYTEIEAIKKAGVTQGSTECGPPATPAYCPGSSVRRDAMAAFMERGFTRVEGASADSIIVNDLSTTTVASVSMEAGAAGAGTNGYVQATITGTVFDETNCPCIVALGISDNGGVVGSIATLVYTSDFAPFSYQLVVPIAGDTTHTYSLVAQVSNLSALSETVSVYGELTAAYIPFDGDAANDSVGATVLSQSGPSTLAESLSAGTNGEYARLIEIYDRAVGD